MRYSDNLQFMVQ